MRNFILFFLVLLNYTLFGQFDEQAINAIITHSLFTEGGGGCLMIVKNDQVLFHRAFGYADIERKIPNSTETVFQIGSISKQFTAAAILLLAERGKLQLTDPVIKYIPDFPSPADSVTIHHLLTHTSGIRNFTSDSGWNPSWSSNRSIMDAINIVKNKPFDFHPGERFSYCNTGYAILAYIIEEVSGRSYGDFMRDEIFLPAGLKHTRSGESTDDIGLRAKGATIDMEKLENKSAVFTEFPQLFGAGSIISTTGDFARWADVIAERELLSDTSWDRITAPLVLTNFGRDTSYYGYGWITMQYRGHKVVWHNGGMAGFLSAFYTLPDDGYRIFWLSNVDVVNADNIVKEVIISLFHLDQDTRTPITLSNEEKKKYEGEYIMTPFSAQVTLAGDALSMQLNQPQQLPATLIPIGADSFCVKEISLTRYKFTRNTSGEITGGTIYLNNRPSTFYKKGFEPKWETINVGADELKEYCGQYSFGPGAIMTVLIKEQKLFGILPGQPEYELVPIAKDTFKLAGLTGFRMSFSRNDKNEITMVMSNQPNGNFPAKKLGVAEPPKPSNGASADELRKYVGGYAFAPAMVMNISIKGNKLHGALPGQPEFDLIPAGKDTFEIEGVTGYKMIFELNMAGEVIAVTSSQPNGDFKAKKEK